MSAKTTLGSAFTAWLALVALQAISTSGGSGRVASLFTDVNNVVTRVLSANIPGVPDLRDGATKPNVNGISFDGLQGATVAAAATVGPGGATGPSPTWTAPSPTKNPFTTTPLPTHPTGATGPAPTWGAPVQTKNPFAH
jgi:hypothetical protein